MKRFRKFDFATALQVTAILILFLFGYPGCSSNDEVKETPKDKAIIKNAAGSGLTTVEVKGDMHKLWEDHVTLTRNVILGLVNELPETDQAVKRLLIKQDDIGNAIKPYYGEEGAKKLSGLLKPHITIAAELVKAAKAGNNVALDEANKRWLANAQEISAFFGNANHYWSIATMPR